MKLLHCSNCESIFSLHPSCDDSEPKAYKCQCGGATGVFVNKFEAIYSGQNCVPIIITNSSLVHAFGKKIKVGKTSDLKCFVPDDRQQHFRKVDDGFIDGLGLPVVQMQEPA